MSLVFSPIMMAEALVLPLTIVGMIDASATLSLPPAKGLVSELQDGFEQIGHDRPGANPDIDHGLHPGCYPIAMTAALNAIARRLDDYLEIQLSRIVDRAIGRDRFGRIRRQFQVDIVGELDGETLILTEDFTYDDGERSRRIWRIDPLGDGRYEGVADDVIGVAQGRALGNALHWQYDLNLPIGERTWQVHFDDWMLRQDDAVALNRATVSKFGVTIGEVVIFFQRTDLSPSSVSLELETSDPKADDRSSPDAMLGSE